MRQPGRCVLIAKFVPLSSPVIPDVRRAREPKVSGARALRSGIHVSIASWPDHGSRIEAGMTAMSRTSDS